MPGSSPCQPISFHCSDLILAGKQAAGKACTLRIGIEMFARARLLRCCLGHGSMYHLDYWWSRQERRKKEAAAKCPGLCWQDITIQLCLLVKAVNSPQLPQGLPVLRASLVITLTCSSSQDLHAFSLH